MILIEGIEIPSELFAQATGQLNFPAKSKIEQICPENVDNLNISGQVKDVIKKSMIKTWHTL